MRRVFSRTVTLPDQLTLAAPSPCPSSWCCSPGTFTNHLYVATGVFVVAMATDQVDGWLARRWNQTSRVRLPARPDRGQGARAGRARDVGGEGVAPAWMVAAIVAREFLVSGLRLAAIEKGVVIGARDLGKLKTWAQAVAVGIGGFAAAGAWSSDIAWWALLVAVVLTWVSGLDYARVAHASCVTNGSRRRRSRQTSMMCNPPSRGGLTSTSQHAARAPRRTTDTGEGGTPNGTTCDAVHRPMGRSAA